MGVENIIPTGANAILRLFTFKTSTMNFKKLFNVVYQPNPELRIQRKRFLVSANTLKSYIGDLNASTALTRASKSKADKTRVRFRKFGIVDIYVK